MQTSLNCKAFFTTQKLNNGDLQLEEWWLKMEIYSTSITKIYTHHTTKMYTCKVFSSVFIFFEAFRLTLVKKNRQNEESRDSSDGSS